MGDLCDSYDTCLVLFKYFNGENISRIEREMRGLGHANFHRRILYDRKERGKDKPGWIERYEWKKLLAVGGRQLAVSEPPAVAGGHRVNPTTRSQEGGFTPAFPTTETSGGKPAFPTASGNAENTPLPTDFHSWLKSVSPDMTWDWKHQKYIIDQLQKVTDGTCKRLMIFLPPRHGKSELVTVRYSAWRMQRDPSLNMILGSYNQRLANRFSRKVRRVITDAVAIENGEGEKRSGGESRNGSVSSSPLSHVSSSASSLGPVSPSPLPRVPSSVFPFASQRPINTVAEWETPCGGGFRAVGVGGGVTGFGAQLIVIDDPVKSRAEAESEKYRERLHDWFNDDIYTRLEPDGAIILIQTRWHEDDLAGRLMQEMTDGGEQWNIIDLPAFAEWSGDTPVPTDASASAPSDSRSEAVGGLGDKSVPAPSDSRSEAVGGLGDKSVPAPTDWRVPGQALCPERFDETALERLRRQLGTYSFSALYQQRPTPADGGTFKREWFKRIVNFAPPGLEWKRGYDLAVSLSNHADYTASFRCAFDEAGNLYIQGGFRKRIEYPDQRRFIIDRILSEPDTEHGVEKALHGEAIIQDLRREKSIHGHSIRAVKVLTDKLTRALAWAPLAEEGKVILVRRMDEGGRMKDEDQSQASSPNSSLILPPSSSAWIPDFLDEVAAFPNGQHDDQIDAVSLAFHMFQKPKNRAAGF